MRDNYVHEMITPLFNARVFLHTKKKAYKKHRSRFSNKDVKLAGSGGMCSKFVTPEGVIILIGVFERGDDILSVLVHESLHAAICLLDIFGVKITPKNHETLCYMQDFIFGSCVSALHASGIVNITRKAVK